ncbi:MAG TPA: hypothetical protein VKH19_10735 [Gemmatimonadaceae bacterium]|nr:hypothetical protein [Gemmatimonadaceae bacterium]
MAPKANGAAFDPLVMFGERTIPEDAAMRSWGEHDQMPAHIPRRAWYAMLALAVLLALVAYASDAPAQSRGPYVLGVGVLNAGDDLGADSVVIGLGKRV